MKSNKSIKPLYKIRHLGYLSGLNPDSWRGDNLNLFKDVSAKLLMTNDINEWIDKSAPDTFWDRPPKIIHFRDRIIVTGVQSGGMRYKCVIVKLHEK